MFAPVPIPLLLLLQLSAADVIRPGFCTYTWSSQTSAPIYYHMPAYYSYLVHAVQEVGNCKYQS